MQDGVGRGGWWRGKDERMFVLCIVVFHLNKLHGDDYMVAEDTRCDVETGMQS
jgi:hypothetical protein